MTTRLITALIALILQVNASVILPAGEKDTDQSEYRNYCLLGFDLFLRQKFFEFYPTAKSVRFINCSIILEERRDDEDNEDFWSNKTVSQFPLERLSFKDSTITRPESLGDVELEPFGNGVQDRLGNFKEILYEGCTFPEGISGSSFFVNSATLTHLKIINCDVLFFEFDAFRSLQNLQHVEIKGTNILINPKMFSKNTKLRYLDIPSNQFTDRLDNDFPTSLEYLDISGYNSMIACHTLKNLGNLKYLNMSNSINLISKTGDCIPSNLKILEVLDFSWNRIQFLTNSFLSGMKKLRELYLNDNELRFIDLNAFKDLSNLEILNLRNNNLVSIKASVFSDLISLNHLYIGNNEIARTTSECIENKEVLEEGYKNDSCLDKFAILEGVNINL